MNKHKNNDGYTVGYKRPPVASQFQKGTSGNPKRRRKMLSNYLEALVVVLREKVRIIENGVPRHVTKHEAIWIRVTNAAARGNKKARTLMARYHEIRAEQMKSRPPRVRVLFFENDQVGST